MVLLTVVHFESVGQFPAVSTNHQTPLSICLLNSASEPGFYVKHKSVKNSNQRKINHVHVYSFQEQILECTNEQINRQTVRQTDRQTDRQRDRQTEYTETKITWTEEIPQIIIVN